MYNKKLIIVDESYTSCTCGQCGHINNIKGNEVFKCSKCYLKIDRDAGGSRNILLKNLKLQ
jgi:putative transposase